MREIRSTTSPQPLEVLLEAGRVRGGHAEEAGVGVGVGVEHWHEIGKKEFAFGETASLA